MPTKNLSCPFFLFDFKFELNTVYCVFPDFTPLFLTMEEERIKKNKSMEMSLANNPRTSTAPERLEFLLQLALKVYQLRLVSLAKRCVSDLLGGLKTVFPRGFVSPRNCL